MAAMLEQHSPAQTWGAWLAWRPSSATSPTRRMLLFVTVFVGAALIVAQVVVTWGGPGQWSLLDETWINALASNVSDANGGTNTPEPWAQIPDAIDTILPSLPTVRTPQPLPLTGTPPAATAVPAGPTMAHLEPTVLPTVPARPTVPQTVSAGPTVLPTVQTDPTALSTVAPRQQQELLASWSMVDPDKLNFTLSAPEGWLGPPLEVGVDTGMTEGSHIIAEGHLEGNVVLAVMNVHGDIIFFGSYQPNSLSYCMFYQASSWHKVPISYPTAFTSGAAVRVDLGVHQDAFTMSINDAESFRVPVETFSNPQLVNIFLIRAYERLPHRVAIARVLGTGLPRQRLASTPPPLDVQAAIKQPALPGPSTEAGQVEIFVGILSAPSNYEARDAVRMTWFQHESVRTGRLAVRFFIGASHDVSVISRVGEEQERFNDVVQIKVPDTYLNVAQKTFAMIETMLEQTKAKYLLKCDDDTFPRLDRILPFLQASGAPPVYMGAITPGSQTDRDPTHRYYISSTTYSLDSVPPFAHGPAYLISRDVAEHIHTNLRQGKLQIASLEDVAMASWVDHAKKEGNLPVRYVSDKRFAIAGCHANDLSGHYIRPQRMRCMWQRLEKDIDDEEWCC